MAELEKIRIATEKSGLSNSSSEIKQLWYGYNDIAIFSNLSAIHSDIWGASSTKYQVGQIFKSDNNNNYYLRIKEVLSTYNDYRFVSDEVENNLFDQNGYIDIGWYKVIRVYGNIEYNNVYSTYSCENKLTYTESPERNLNGDLNNDEIETFYVPTATFVFDYVNADVYSKIIQLVNTKGFWVQYYDYEIRRVVKRNMYMTENSLSELHIVGSNLKGFTSVKLTFVSKKSYASYTELYNTTDNS